MGAMKQLLEEVAWSLGINDISDPRVAAAAEAELKRRALELEELQRQWKQQHDV